MAQTNMSPKAFNATEALPQFRVVKLTAASGTAVEFADAGEAGIGTTQDDVALGEDVAIMLFNAGGSFKAVAAEAFVVGAALYTANDGKVQDTVSGVQRFTALEPASGDGSIVEVLPNGNADVV